MPRKESPNIEAVRVYAARRSMLHVWEKTTRFSVARRHGGAWTCRAARHKTGHANPEGDPQGGGGIRSAAATRARTKAHRETHQEEPACRLKPSPLTAPPAAGPLRKLCDALCRCGPLRPTSQVAATTAQRPRLAVLLSKK
jgi:hypothetical protein